MTFVTSVIEAHLSISVLLEQTQLNAFITVYHVLQHAWKSTTVPGSEVSSSATFSLHYW